MKSRQLSFILIIISIILLSSSSLGAQIYTQEGTDLTWQYIVDNNLIPIARNSTAGITGSEITVNREFLETGMYGHLPIDSNISIHTLGNSRIRRNDFDKWSRWYQEDGNTQIFRLFAGEKNVRNNRAGSPRIEAFSPVRYSSGWNEWVGRYTIIKAQNLNIFQIFGDGPGGNTGQMMLELRANGDVIFNPRRSRSHARVTLLTNTEGTSFDIRVRHNGNEYEIYVNGELRIEHFVESRNNHFRWGMYGHNDMPGDAMIMITGATVNPEGITPPAEDASTLSSSIPVVVSEPKGPYTGEAVTLPGTILAVEYDKGGEGVSYHDTIPENRGAERRGVELRVNENVDMDNHPDGGYVIGWIAAGEWVEYTVNVTQAGEYDLIFHTGSLDGGGSIGIDVNGETLLSGIAVPQTHDWHTYTTFTESVNLVEGEQVWRVNMENSGFNLYKIVVE